MVQFLSIIFFFSDFFNFCWVFQKLQFFYVILYMPVPVAARPRAWDCGRSIAGTVYSNPTGGMDVCLS